MTKRFGDYLLISTALSAITASGARAQDAPAAAEHTQPLADNALTEITVTARRREESQQKVPVAVSVITPVQLTRRATFDPLDLPQLAPGLVSQNGNSVRNNYYFTIRGESFTTGTLYSAVLPYVAEAPLIKLTPGQFFDLQDVQVLRGPQGTLFGRVTNGGDILLTPKRPGFALEGYVTQQYGSYDLHSTAGALTLPLIADVLSVRGAFEIGRQNGYVTNVTNGAKFNNNHYESGRFSVLFTPTPSIENLTIVNYNHSNEEGTDSRASAINVPVFTAFATRFVGAATAAQMAAQLTKAVADQTSRPATETALNSPGYDRHKALYLVNKTTFKIAPKITLKNIFSYQTFKQFYETDYDGSTLPIFVTETRYFPANLDDRKFYSNETQVQASALNDKLDLTAGFYLDRNAQGGPTEGFSQYFGVFLSDQVQSLTASSMAVYGQASYDLSSLVHGLKLNGGVRWTEDKEHGNAASYSEFLTAGATDNIPHGQCLSALPPSAVRVTLSQACTYQTSDIKTVTYMYGLDYEIAAHTLVYGKISRGYRPGGFNFIPGASDIALYKPEFDLSREIGLKSDWSIGGVKIRTNISGFIDTKSDVQVRGAVSVNGVSYSSILSLPGHQTIKGIELESVISPGGGFQLISRYAHMTSRTALGSFSQDYINAACTANPQAIVPDGTKACPLNKVARLPHNTLGLEARYGTSLGSDVGHLDTGLDFEYVSSQYSTDANYLTPDVLKPSYSLFNADLRITDFLGKPIDLAIFVTNLTDKKYWVAIGSLTQAGSFGFGQGTRNIPRMIGGSVKLRFGK
jgi:iron complex outermembrane receptor protein